MHVRECVFKPHKPISRVLRVSLPLKKSAHRKKMYDELDALCAILYTIVKIDPPRYEYVMMMIPRQSICPIRFM